MLADSLSIEVARQLFEETPTPVRDIAVTVDCNERTVYRWAERHGWKRFQANRRIKLVPVAGETAPAGSSVPATPPLADDIQARRRAMAALLLDGVGHQIAAAIARASAIASPADLTEKDARLFALLARSIQQLALLERDFAPQRSDADHEPPRDIDQLRQDLSQRLARFITEDAGTLPREPEPAGT